MIGHVVEFEYAKGFGRVELDDGRVLPFDLSACREGVPDSGARVAVELVPSRLGGEKVGSLRVEEAWAALPTEVPFLRASATHTLLVRDGAATWSPPWVVEPPPVGTTGYATIEVKQGVTGHSTAWHASAYGRPGERDERVAAMREAELGPDERALFHPRLKELLEELFDDVYNPDQRESPHREENRAELAGAIELAERFGVDTTKFRRPRRG